MKAKILIATLVLALSLTACADQGFKENVGTVLGGVAGGVVGSKFGKGHGQVWATGAGAMLGALAGKELGRQLDERDLMMNQRAVESSYTQPLNRPIRWNNPDTGHSGSVTPIREGYQEGSNSVCREYEQKITVGGRTETAVGTACKNPDGTWAIQSN